MDLFLRLCEIISFNMEVNSLESWRLIWEAETLGWVSFNYLSIRFIYVRIIKGLWICDLTISEGVWLENGIYTWDQLYQCQPRQPRLENLLNNSTTSVSSIKGLWICDLTISEGVWLENGIYTWDQLYQCQPRQPRLENLLNNSTTSVSSIKGLWICKTFNCLWEKEVTSLQLDYDMIVPPSDGAMFILIDWE